MSRIMSIEWLLKSKGSRKSHLCNKIVLLYEVLSYGLATVSMKTVVS